MHTPRYPASLAVERRILGEVHLLRHPLLDGLAAAGAGAREVLLQRVLGDGDGDVVPVAREQRGEEAGARPVLSETRPVRALPDGLDAREDAALGHLSVGGHLRERDRRMVQHRVGHLKRGCGV